MAQKFIGKKPHKKYVRPALNSKIPHRITLVEEENKVHNNEVAMNEEKINKLEDILGSELPKKKTKVLKKDKGLIERDEKSTILITEDNKLVLND